MKLLQPTDIIKFGKNSGLTLAEIYKYQPSYLEWAIVNISDFKIDIDVFEKLPIPTTIGYMPENFLNEDEITIETDINIILSKRDLFNYRVLANVFFIRELIANGGEIDDLKQFNFPSKIKEINNSKV